MMTIDNIHLPLEVERGFSGGPAYFTTILSAPNGARTAVQHREQALNNYTLSLVGMRDTNIKSMLTFFHGRRGPAYGFLFKDWTDYKMPLQLIGTGNAVLTDFWLINTYADAVRPYLRYITRPVLATLKVYKNAVLQTYTTHYTFVSGKVHFLAAPADTVAITAECEFDIVVQFSDDQFTSTMLHSTQGLVPSFKIDEIPEYAQLI